MSSSRRSASSRSGSSAVVDELGGGLGRVHEPLVGARGYDAGTAADVRADGLEGVQVIPQGEADPDLGVDQGLTDR